jgi:hypothetical protein
MKVAYDKKSRAKGKPARAWEIYEVNLRESHVELPKDWEYEVISGPIDGMVLVDSGTNIFKVLELDIEYKEK